MKLRLLILCLVAISQCDADGSGADTSESKEKKAASEKRRETAQKEESTNTMPATVEWEIACSLQPKPIRRPGIKLLPLKSSGVGTGIIGNKEGHGR